MEKQDIRIIKDQMFKQSFARLMKFAGAHQEEQWVSDNSDPLNICPICSDLQDLGWVQFGLLPAYKHAHSIIGEGNWKAPDSSCLCVKGYRRVSGPGESDVVPLSGDTGANPLSSYFAKAESDRLKIDKLKEKYKNNCNHDAH